jgi:cyclic pyranopterin phosphate synthase
MSPEEISEIAKAFRELGVKKVKITGGEPLLRRDIVEIVEMLPEFDEVSMTTNGILLDKYAFDLKDAGLSRVNISLDSLNPSKYKNLTGGEFKKVISGIETAVQAELTPIKLNMVVMKGINDDEVQEMIEFTSRFNRRGINVILQIIELLKLPNLEDYYFDIGLIENEVAKKAEDFRVRAMHHRRQYYLNGTAVEFVRPMDNTEFCYNCNRIRVTTDGKIKACLLRDDNLIDVKGLRGEELKKKIFEAVGLREPYFSGGD